MMIMIAGPYRSGTNDDPKKIAANVNFMESFAVPIFRKGHIPLRCACSINATPSCAWAAHLLAQT